jgi:preprotein translocase subunit SecE
MSLVVGTVLLVVVVTAVVGMIAYALDRSTARQERKDNA